MKDWKHATQQEIDDAIFDESIEAISITINHLKAELEAARKEIDAVSKQIRDELLLKSVVGILVLVAYVLYILFKI